MRIRVAITLLLLPFLFRAQVTIVQNNFEGATAYPVAANATASGVTCSATSTETFVTFGGTNTGSGAFTSDNASSTTSLGMTNSSGTNTRYFQFQLGGANLSCYKCYKIYFQGQRSSTGATTVTLQYSTNGSTYTSFATTATIGTSFNECSFDLCSVTALDNQSSVYFRLYTSGASGSGTLRLDNFQVKATSLLSGAVSASSFTLNCATASATVSYTAVCANAGNVFSVLLSDASGGYSNPTTVGTLTSTATTGTISVTLPSTLPTGTGYALQVTSSNPAMSSLGSANFAVTNSCVTCPSLTGAILDACNSGCNEGDAEVMFFNMGTYSVNVASLPSHVVNYYGNVTNLNNGTINAYTGTFSSNAATTTALNSSTGCSGTFIDAASAGTIPAGATVMMVPSTFCATNYNFSNLCSAFSPIYVLYFGTTGWNSTGNLSNQSTPSPNLKYLSVNWSGANSNCGTQYYNFDAGLEAGSDGAAVSYPGSISNLSASQTSPNNYTTSGCTLPAVLPLDLLSFTARRNSTEAIVDIVTVHEEQLSLLKVSKSYDGFHYSPFSSFTPHNTEGEHHYRVYDELDDALRTVYFRLEEEDLNGKVKFLSSCMLEAEGKQEITVLQSASEIRIFSPVPIAMVQLYSVGGACVMQYEPVNETFYYSISGSLLSKGLYLLSVDDVNGKATVKKLVR